MNSSKKERRDWGLIIFIIPIGILLLIIVAQIAIRVAPNWSLFGNMRSNLDPNTTSPKPISFFQPILPQILTPMAWAESYLTPGGEISFPPFIIINPATPTPTSSVPTSIPTTPPAPATGTATNAVPPTPTPIISIPSRTPTEEVPEENTATPVPPPTSTSTNPPTQTNVPTNTPTATPTGYPSTPPPYPEVPPPGEIGGTPDDTPADLPPGSYTILDIGIIDTTIPDANFGDAEIIFYEYFNPIDSTVYLDQIIIGVIPDSDLSDGFNYYYQVLNWGDNNRDTNTNVDYPLLPVTNCSDECDNRQIPPGILIGPYETGILIDVDNAPSMPPPDIYYYIIIISPPGADPAQIDAVTLTGL
ncbi:MAG: hypothetical protein DPW18_03210 [Chloroflexi bacterium]|nr:hypothetical protein [Chloroflexota bacterium]MDL1943015.1 hypothetical protein [Chloroflexi bacterium CFX2]